jgi:coatomer protein complex subunit gamma
LNENHTEYFNLALNVSLSSLEQLLQRYTMESTNKPFDIRSVPIQAAPEPVKNLADRSAGLPQGQTDLVSQRDNTYNGKFKRNIYLLIFLFQFIEKLTAIPEFAHLGSIFKSSLPVDLTESEVEYVVRCIKHVFGHYIVFQVNILLIFIQNIFI